MEKVDVLLATYNGEQYLQEQIESILNQTYTDFRLLISDDGSKDKTIDIVEEYAKKDDRIIIFKQNENMGVVKNFEFLMKQVQSKYFMFSDQDDIWKKDKIEKSVKKIEEGAFGGCNELTSFHFPRKGSVDSIGERAFSDSTINSITIPSYVK